MFYSGAKPGDTCFADVVAINDGIFAVLEKKPISFTDDQVALILRLARGMSQTRRGRLLDEIARRLPPEPTDRDIRLAIELAAGAVP